MAPVAAGSDAGGMIEIGSSAKTPPSLFLATLIALRRLRPEGRRYRARLLARDLRMLGRPREAHVVDIRV